MVDFTFPSLKTVDAVFRRHFGDPLKNGWRVRMRHKFGYFLPEEWYQTVVDQLVTDKCRWIDVGGGKSIFPDNPKLSMELAERCAYLVGVDPSDGIDQNEMVDERVRSTIEEFRSDELFDLATLRMVAEHISEPDAMIQSLARLIRTTGCVVVYTPNKWSLLAVAASLIPNRLHASFSRLLWPDRKDEDVFPTSFKMNTKKRLQELFEAGGFSEVGFAYLDDCVLMQRFRISAWVEFALWKAGSLAGFRYPENNLLAIYQKR